MPDEDTQNLARTMNGRGLRQAAAPNPELTEQHTQRCGDRHLVAGVILLSATLLFSVGATAVDTTPLNGDPIGFALALLALFMSGMLSAVLIAAGLSEHRERPGRAAVLQASRIAIQNAGRLDAADKRMATVERLLTQVLAETQANGGLARQLSTEGLDVLRQHGERIGALEKVVERVPLYSEAVLDGIDLGRGVAGGNEGRF